MPRNITYTFPTDPAGHKANHQDGGDYEINVTSLTGLLTDDQHVLDAEVKLIRLDDLATTEDNTDLNASTSAHGLLKKLDNNAGNYMDGQGNWSAPGMTAVTKTDDYTIQTSDLDVNSLRMNAATAKTFTMCSLGSGEDGDRLTLIKQGAGRVTLQMVDSDFVDDSSATGTIYTETLYATITLEYVHGMLRLVIISALGQWITT